MKILISDDGQTWTTIAEPDVNNNPDWQKLPAGVTARYIQFAFENPAKAPQLGFLAEVRFLP